MSPDVTCRELVALLDDYLEGTLDGPRLAAMNAHLTACPSCVAYMKTYAASTRLARAALLTLETLPQDVPEGLVQAILAARL